MTKEELKLEAIRYLENFKDCANCKNRWGDCADQLDEYCLINGCCFATPKEQDIYLAGAEPREKQIAELEDKLANADYQLEGRDLEIKELKEQIEKLIDFILSKTECCDVCPMTDTCINSEGTCPYVGILAKGEEEVTREWLMQFISKEIKEK